MAFYFYIQNHLHRINKHNTNNVKPLLPPNENVPFSSFFLPSAIHRTMPNRTASARGPSPYADTRPFRERSRLLGAKRRNITARRKIKSLDISLRHGDSALQKEEKKLQENKKKKGENKMKQTAKRHFNTPVRSNRKPAGAGNYFTKFLNDAATEFLRENGYDHNGNPVDKLNSTDKYYK